MAFSEAQAKLLAGKLSAQHVKTREQHGRTLSYIEGWHAIAEANRIFGFEGWDRETVWAECVWQDGKSELKACAYAARVRIRVRAGETVVCREGSGAGQGSGANLGEAHENALKEAETDATKRALATFGNRFGLALYDKEQAGVRRRGPPPGIGYKVGVSWAVLSGSGALMSRHDTPEGFCGALRERLEGCGSLADLQALWARNASTVEHLRRAWPQLRTVNRTHYAEILDKLYQQQIEKLKPAEPVDKSALALGAPKRLRDRDHLAYVASLPCLVCGRQPCQAHHLRFAQPRAMGSKVSDEWAVPLCVLHHRALHDVGDEAEWWERQGIDAKAEAEKLWQQHRRGGNGAEPPGPTRPTNGHAG